MAQYYKGTLLASPIVRGSSGDTYGTHHSILGVGGYMEVNTLAEMYVIPPTGSSQISDLGMSFNYDGISIGQRRLGMLVYVRAEDTIYQLKVDNWDSLTLNSKQTAITNPANWIIFVAGGDANLSAEHITKTFYQLTHGFSGGTVVAWTGGTENIFQAINNVTAAINEPLGIVSEVIDSNNFKLTLSGYISTSGMTDVLGSGLTSGTLYYLSSIDGLITSEKPSGNTNVNKPILVAMSGNTGIVLQYRGIYDNIGTLSYDLFTGYTATTQVFLDKTVTGATNLGYFTGYTGVQTLPITYYPNGLYDGDYVSQYNDYYRDNLGYVRIGLASDGLQRRGYLRTTLPVKSWIWNEYTGDSASIGWIFVNADVSSDVVYGTKVTGSSVQIIINPITATSFNEGVTYGNSPLTVAFNPTGNLISGTTYDIGGPIYRDKVNKELRLRTLISETPEISVEYDDYFIKISGTSAVSDVENIGTGVGIYSGTTGSTLLFKSLVGGGDTTILDNGAQIIITSTGGGGTGGSGENVTKTIIQLGHGFALNEAIGWSGGAYTKAIADGTYDGEILGIVTNVINTDTFNLTQSGYITGLTGFVTNSTYFVSPTVAGALTLTAPTTVGQLVKSMFIANSTTSGWVLPYPGYIITPPITGGTGGGSIYYTGATPSAIEVGGIGTGTILTGKTFTELFEEMLVPELCGTVTAPSLGINLSASGLYEIDCNLSQTVTGNFNRGCINPQYCSVSQYRSDLPNAYCFTGTGMPSGFQTCTALSASQTNASYDVLIGTQSWGVQTRYDCGDPALGSKGTEYCAALPSGCTTTVNNSVVGVYPLWGTCSTISTISKISPLYNMSTQNNICIPLPAESGGNKQKFEIPCAWLGAPTNRPLVGVCLWNTVSAQWEYPGGSAACSLNLWCCGATTENVQGNSIGYCQYSHCCSDRGGVCIRLVF